MWPFKRKEPEAETRSSGTGYTSQVMQARADYIAGVDGVAELTGTVQGCASLWEGGLSLSDVEGTDMLTPAMLALAGRALALRGEAVFLIREDGLLPCSDWDLTTRNSKPTAYRVGIPDTGGGKTETVLSGEVLHLRIGADMAMPYVGQSPLRRARLTAGLLQTLEAALSEVFANAPLGSSVIPFPEAPDQDMSDLARGFRGFRGKVLVRESVNVTAAGGPAPQAFGVYQDPEQYGEVVWRFSPEAAERAAEFLFHPTQVVEPQDDGSLIVRFKAAGWLEMAWHLYQWGDKVDVLAPQGLRKLIAGHQRSDFDALP